MVMFSNLKFNPNFPLPKKRLKNLNCIKKLLVDVNPNTKVYIHKITPSRPLQLTIMMSYTPYTPTQSYITDQMHDVMNKLSPNTADPQSPPDI